MITKEQYEDAIAIATQYRIENDGFYAKLTTWDGNHEETVDVNYYDDLNEMAEQIWRIGNRDGSVVTDCVRITKKEYEENSLPF